MDYRQQEQINELLEQLSQAHIRIDQLEEQLKLNAQNQSVMSKTLRESAVAKSVLLEKKSEQNDKLQNEVEINKIVIQSQQAQLERLQAELTTQKEETQFYKDEYQKLESTRAQEVKQLRAELLQHEAAAAAAAADATAATAQADGLNQQVKSQHLEVQKLKNEIFDLQKQNKELQQQKQKNEAKELENKEVQTQIEAKNVILQDEYEILEVQCIKDIQELTEQLSEQISATNAFCESYNSYKRKYEATSILYDELIAEFEKTQELLKESDTGKLKSIIIEYSKQMTDVQLANTKLIMQCQKLQEAAASGQETLNKSETNGLTQRKSIPNQITFSRLKKSTNKDHKEKINNDLDDADNLTMDFTISLDSLRKTKSSDTKQ